MWTCHTAALTVGRLLRNSWKLSVIKRGLSTAEGDLYPTASLFPGCHPTSFVCRLHSCVSIRLQSYHHHARPHFIESVRHDIRAETQWIWYNPLRRVRVAFDNTSVCHRWRYHRHRAAAAHSHQASQSKSSRKRARNSFISWNITWKTKKFWRAELLAENTIFRLSL